MHRIVELVLERNEELEKKQEQFTALLIQHDAELRALLEQLEATLPQIRTELDSRLSQSVPALVSQAYGEFSRGIETRCSDALKDAAERLESLRSEVAKLAAEKFTAAEKQVGVSLAEIEQRLREGLGQSAEARAIEFERGLLLRIADEMAKQAEKSVELAAKAQSNQLIDAFKGPFEPGMAVKRGEIVTYLGATYIALEAVAEAPTRRIMFGKRPKWALLAARGAAGAGAGGGGGAGGVPDAHAASHASGGSDQITLAQSQVTDLTTDLSGKLDTSALAAGVEDFLATPSSANLAAAVTDETGTGALVLGTNPSLAGYTLTGARVVTPTTLAGTEVDVTKPESVKALSSSPTLTFSNATPTTGTEFRLTLTADGTDRTAIIPSSFSINLGQNRTTIPVPANNTAALTFRYTGARWEVFGDPVATVGSGSFQLGTYANPSRQHFEITFDPKAVCDGDEDNLFLFTVSSTWAPNGIVLRAWRISFEADPTTELDVNAKLKRADDWISLGNAADMDVIGTTAGVASETTAANINGGATVAAGQVIYLAFGTAYAEQGHQCIFELEYTLA